MWDGNTVVQQSQITADGTALKSTEYLYEPDTFRPMAQVETNHQTGRERLHYIVTDHAGTPQELCSPTGEIEWRGDQALWGNYYQRTTKVNRGYREEAANDVIHCDLRYQGQLEDTESGLYYNLNRYYDADSGQYLSPDPIGFAGGMRPQGYVDNPVGFVDPLGLSGCSIESVKWKKGPNIWKKGKLSEHYNKHVVKQGEFGDITMKQYHEQMEDFLLESSPNFKQAKIGNQLIKFDPNTNRVLVGHAKDREILSFYKAQPNLVKDDPFTDAVNEALRKTGVSPMDVIYK